MVVSYYEGLGGLRVAIGAAAGHSSHPPGAHSTRERAINNTHAWQQSCFLSYLRITVCIHPLAVGLIQVLVLPQDPPYHQG